MAERVYHATHRAAEVLAAVELPAPELVDADLAEAKWLPKHQRQRTRLVKLVELPGVDSAVVVAVLDSARR